MSKWLRLLFLVCLLFFVPFCINSFSAPSINSVSNIASGSEFVLSGTSFTNKEKAPPLKFENFENGTNGANITSTGYWSSDGTVATFSDTGTRSGGLVAKQVIAGSGVDGNMHDLFYRTGLDFSSTGKAYLSFWVDYSRGSVTPGNQIKLFRINGEDLSNIYPSIAWFDSNGWRRYQLTKANSSGDSGSTDTFSGSAISEDSGWQFVEMELDFGTLGNSDGSIRLYVDGVEQHNENGLNFLTYPEYTFKTVRFGEYAADSDGRATEYFDDIYIDNSFARVLLCEGSTFLNRGACEVQLPKSWSDSSIEVSVNLGAFSNGENAFLYVVDDDGVSNSDGFPININAGTNDGGIDKIVEPIPELRIETR